MASPISNILTYKPPQTQTTTPQTVAPGPKFNLGGLVGLSNFANVGLNIPGMNYNLFGGGQKKAATPSAPAPQPGLVAAATPSPSPAIQAAPPPPAAAAVDISTPVAPKRTLQTNSFADKPVRGLFSDVVSSLARPEANQQTKDAIKFYQDAVEKLGGFEREVAGKRRGIYDEPTSARVMSAREMALQAITAEERARLQDVIQEAQAGIGFGLTEQQLQQAALSSAATYAQPSVAGYGQTTFDPLTGTFSGGQDGLDPRSVAIDLAQKVANNEMTYEQAVASLGYAGGAGQQFLNQALQGVAPNFNIPRSTATITGQADVFGQLPALESADTAAEGIKNKITTYLASNPQLNPSALAAGNVLQQWIQGKQLSDPKYQTLFNYLNEYTNTLAPILGVGGDPTNLKTQIAQSFINAAASGQSISEVLENIQGLSRGKIQDIRSGAAGGGVVSTPQTGGGTGSGGLYDW